MNGTPNPQQPDQRAKETPSPPPPTFSKAWWRLKWAAWDESVPFGPLVIALLVFGVAVALAWFYPSYIRKKGDPSKWAELLQTEMIATNFTYAATGVPPDQKARIEEQARHVGNRAEHHFKVMQYYYTNYYVSLLLGSVYGGLAAISLVLLTKAGWKEGGSYLASFFLTTTVCTTFFFTFPTWCQMDSNVTKNKALYVRYVGLLNDVRTFAALGTYAQDPQPTNQITVTNFILRMDTEMRKANDIAVAFDASKGPIYNLSDKVPK